MIMNAKSAAIGIAIAMAASTASIAAAQPEGMGEMPGGQGRMAPPTPEQQVDHMVSRMAEHLGLTEAQQAELKSIFLEQNNKHRQVSEETQTRVLSVLTDEQKKKLEASRQMPGGGAPGQAQPPMR